jgi:hypothetical protein
MPFLKNYNAGVVFIHNRRNWLQDQILRLLSLQLQRQRCSRLERFLEVEENIVVLKTH